MYLIVGLFLGLGCYLILLDLIKAPTLGAIQAASNVGTEKTGIINTLLDYITVKLSSKITIPQKIREETARKIEQAHLYTTVEAYLLRPYLFALIGCLIGLPVILVLPIAYLFVLLFAFLIFRNEHRQADQIIAVHEKEIEKELPRFVMTLAQELEADKSVFHVLSNYKQTAGKGLKEELTQVVSEMQIGSQEQALLNFADRVHHPLLNNVIKGLLSKLRGDDTTNYFSNLSEDLKILERNRLKMEAIKIPGKFEKYNFLLFIFFAMLFFVPLIIQFIDNLNIFLT